MDSVTIDPEFQALIPRPTAEELAELAAALGRDGCREPLLVWNGVLLDGHNRKFICDTQGIAYQTVTLELPHREAAKIWIIKNQFGRRNLSDMQRAELALRLKPLLAGEAKKRQKEAGGALPQKSVEAPQDTQKELAKLAGVSHDTIHKVEKITRQAVGEVAAAARRYRKDALEVITMRKFALTEAGQLCFDFMKNRKESA